MQQINLVHLTIRCQCVARGEQHLCVRQLDVLRSLFPILLSSQLPSALNWSSLPSTKMIYHSTFSCDLTFVINPQQWDSQVLSPPRSDPPPRPLRIVLYPSGESVMDRPRDDRSYLLMTICIKTLALFPFSHAPPPSLLALDKCGLFLSCRRSELISHGPRALALITLPAKTEISHSPIGPAISQWLTPACTLAWHCAALLRFGSETESGPVTSWGTTTGRNSTPCRCFQKARVHRIKWRKAKKHCSKNNLRRMVCYLFFFYFYGV